MLSKPEFSKKQIIFLFANEGDKLSFSNDNIIVKDKDGIVKHKSTCYKIFMLCIVGHITITSGILQRAKKFGFSIVLMNQSLRVYQIICSYAEGNTLLRKKQYGYDSLELGRVLVLNKIDNQYKTLNRVRNKMEKQKEAIRKIKEQHVKLTRLVELDVATIMGLEGSAARIYFKNLFDFAGWEARRPRIKCDYINSALDIGYTILFNYVEAILGTYGFDLYYGVFHRCFYMRKSLVCDIMEPMRPIIDYQIRKSIKLNQFLEDDFELLGHRYVLKWKENPKYVKLFISAILEYKEDIFEYIQSYYRNFMKNREVWEFEGLEL